MNRGNYIAALAAGAALTLSSSARAESFFQIEAGVGMSSAVKGSDGLWYWQAATHSTPVNSVAGRAGIQFNISQPDKLMPGVRMHLTYNYFGHYSWHASAGFDSNATKSFGYNSRTHSCYNNDCGQYRWFDSTGNLQFVALTVEPFWNLGDGWTFGVEVGPALYRASWNVVATAQTDGVFGPAGSQEFFHRSPSIQVGALGGLSLGKGPVMLRVEYLYAPISNAPTGTSSVAGSNQVVPAGIKGGVMATLNYTY